MAGQAVNRSRTFKSGAAIAPHRLVKMDGANVDQVVVNTATATDNPVAVSSNQDITAADVWFGAELLDEGKTVLMTAAGAITANAVVYAAAAGKVQALPGAAATYRKIGIAMEAAGADGDVIEVMPYDFNGTTVVT